MSEDTTFTAENPFLRLDKSLFRSRKDAAPDDAVPSPKAKRNGPKKPTARVPEAGEDGSFREAMHPEDIADTETFLSAVAGARPLNAGGAASGREVVRGKKTKLVPDLHNPVLPPESVPAFRRLSHSGMPAPTPAENSSPETPSPAFFPEEPMTRREQRRRESREAVQRAQARPPQSEELAFASAMQDVKPLAGKGRAVAPEVVPPPMPPVPSEETNPLQDFMDGKLEFTLASTDEYVEGHILGLDLITVGKLQAGQYSPESHLDLHGLNAAQAFQSLVGFIKGAYLKGQRTVLVVPGRGRNSPQGMPVLRSKVQHWLTQEPFRRVVLAFCTARPADGGAGALYVLLRKLRKDRGKVHWDRKPADPDLL